MAAQIPQPLGTGITHSEFNPSDSEPCHLYQIWLFPARQGIAPSYEQKRFSDDEMHNRLRLAASPTAAEGSLTIHQDASIFLAKLEAGQQVIHAMAQGRHAWLQVLRGSVSLNGSDLSTRATGRPSATSRHCGSRGARTPK